MIGDCHRSARILLAAGERVRHPDWSDEQVSLAVSKRLVDGNSVEIWRQIIVAKVDAPDSPLGPGSP